MERSSVRTAESVSTQEGGSGVTVWKEGPHGSRWPGVRDDAHGARLLGAQFAVPLSHLSLNKRKHWLAEYLNPVLP